MSLWFFLALFTPVPQFSWVTYLFSPILLILWYGVSIIEISFSELKSWWAPQVHSGGPHERVKASMCFSQVVGLC